VTWPARSGSRNAVQGSPAAQASKDKAVTANSSGAVSTTSVPGPRPQSRADSGCSMQKAAAAWQAWVAAHPGPRSDRVTT
jgi:hypothetical protein